MPESQLSYEQLVDSIKAKIRLGDNHLRSAGVQLLEARRRSSDFGLPFLSIIGKCGLEKSRAYQLIAIAEGRTSLAEVQAGGRERAARHAEKNKAARSSVSNGHPWIGKIVKTMKGASPTERVLWEAFNSERLRERQRTGDPARLTVSLSN